MTRPLAALVLLLSTLAARAETPLVWNFDQPTFINVEHDAAQSINVLGRKTDTKTKIRFLFEAKPSKLSPDGANVLDMTILACEDSSAAGNAPPEKGTLKGFTGVKFQLTLTARNQSVEIAGGDAIAAAVFGDDYKNATADEKTLLQDIAVTVLKTHLHDAFISLPAKPVNPGDKWTGPAVVKVPPLAHLTVDRQYTLAPAKPDPAALAITWTSKVTIKPLANDKNVLPFTVKDIKLADGAKYDGSATWDTAARRPTKVDSDQAYQMKLIIEIKGEAIEGSGGGTDKFTATFSAQNPDAKK